MLSPLQVKDDFKRASEALVAFLKCLGHQRERQAMRHGVTRLGPIDHTQIAQLAVAALERYHRLVAVFWRYLTTGLFCLCNAPMAFWLRWRWASTSSGGVNASHWFSETSAKWSLLNISR